MKRSTAIPLVLLALLATSCSGILGETPVPPGSRPATTLDNPSTSAPPSQCVRFTGGNVPIATGSLAGDALFLSGETFLCADDVVVVAPGDLNDLVVASQLAAALSGPLLLPEPRLAAELGRLKPATVHVLGSADIGIPSTAERIDHDRESAVELTRSVLGVSEEVPVPEVPDATTIVETVLATIDRDRVVVPQEAVSSTTTPPPTPQIDAEAVVTGLALPSESESLWLVDSGSPDTILLASAVARSVGATVIAVDTSDLLANPQVGEAVSGHTAESIRMIGTEPESTAWELAVLTNGQQLPGGGFYVLPRDGLRRYVAFYGHPSTGALGVLGEQGPAETLDRMQDLVDAYAGDGAQVVPTFEIIASVASAGPTDDGDYSFEWPEDTFDTWVDFARENGVYILLDLQSGRDDFLSQAVQYEQMLRLPFVGLALDPEWRLLPDQVHLEQTGSVTAAEVNEVVNWVADLVRDNGLPQKMMMVHQFRTDMIQNRQDIISRPEIQMIIQMDGDGTEPQKDATWSRLLEGASDAHWAWGWKNFFDEDEPGPPSPESTMSKQPTPVYVSYQ